MTSLRDRAIAVLSAKPQSVIDLPAVVPDDIGHGVLRWGSSSSEHHLLLHVREDVAVHWNLKVRGEGGKRPPLSPELTEAITTWLASISPDELAHVTADNPLHYVPRPVWAPFDGFAVLHPTLTGYTPNQEDELLAACTYRAFPCFASEIPEQNDLRWYKAQLVDINWSDLTRTPASAVRFARQARGTKKKPRRRLVLRPQAASLSGYRADGEAFEFENWKTHTLRFEGTTVTCSNGKQVEVAWKTHAIALLRTFLDRDELDTTGAGGEPDALATIWDQVEAVVGDVEDGVEPVSILERFTGRTIARLRVRLEGPTLTIEHEIIDDRLGLAGLDQAIDFNYLRRLANDFYRGKAPTLRLWPRGDASAVRERPYPVQR